MAMLVVVAMEGERRGLGWRVEEGVLRAKYIISTVSAKPVRCAGHAACIKKTRDSRVFTCSRAEIMFRNMDGC